jgi:hypothetical protein
VPLALRAAAIERDWFLVDIAVFMSLAAWVPDGYRPLWLPLAFGGAAALFVVVSRALGRGLSALAERLLRRGRGPTIRTDGDGFTIRAGARAPEVRYCWRDVERAYAFKRDLYTTDLVCLALATRDGVVELNERDDGWQAFAEALEERLPGCEPYGVWYLDVIKVPFAARTHRIYGPASEAKPPPAEPAPAAACDDQESYAGGSATVWTSLRDYLACGTAPLVLAAAFVLAVVGAVHGPRSLIYAFMPVALAYVALSRIALGAWLAIATIRARANSARPENGS